MVRAAPVFAIIASLVSRVLSTATFVATTASVVLWKTGSSIGNGADREAASKAAIICTRLSASSVHDGERPDDEVTMADRRRADAALHAGKTALAEHLPDCGSGAGADGP